MFAPYGIDDILHQYNTLRSIIIPELLRGPEGQGVWTVDCFHVRLSSGGTVQVPPNKLELAGPPLSKTFVDASLQMGSPGCVGKAVVVCVGQERVGGIIAKVDRHATETQVYKLLMTLEYHFVSRNSIWAILRLYHRVVMAAMTSEAMAETVCSMMACQLRRVGRPTALSDIANAVRLRSYGVTGNGRDTRFIAHCMDSYFRLPAGETGKWHFWKSEKYEKRWVKHACPLGPSPPIHKHRLELAVRDKSPWLSAPLQVTIQGCARKHLMHEVDNNVHMNPRAGYVLRGSSSLADTRMKMQAAAAAALPDRLSDDVDLKTSVACPGLFPKK